MIEGNNFVANTREIDRLDFEHSAFDQMIPVVVDYTDRDDYAPLKTGDDLTNNRVLKEISEAIDYYHDKYPNRLIGELKINLDNEGYVVDYYAPAKATVDFNSIEKEDHDPLDLENDKEKLADFIELCPDEFLNSYSYLTEDVYVATCQKYGIDHEATKEEKINQFKKLNIFKEENSEQFLIEDVTDEAIVKYGRELANYPKYTHNKKGEAVGLSNEEAKFLGKRSKSEVFKEAIDAPRECGVNGVARLECLRQEVR